MRSLAAVARSSCCWPQAVRRRPSRRRRLPPNPPATAAARRAAGAAAERGAGRRPQRRRRRRAAGSRAGRRPLPRRLPPRRRRAGGRWRRRSRRSAAATADAAARGDAGAGHADRVRHARRAPIRASDCRRADGMPVRPRGISGWSRRRRRRRSSSASPTPTSRSPGSTSIQGNYNGFQIFDISTPEKPTLVLTYVCPASQSDVSVLQEPAVRVGRRSGRARRLRHPGRARAGQQGSPARHSHLRYLRHGQPEVHHQRADVPRLAHAYGRDRSARQGERLHLRVGSVGRPLGGRTAGLLRRRHRRSEDARASASK